MKMSESTGRMITRKRASDYCEGCGRGGSLLEHAHRKSRAQGGGWEPSNALRLCRTCHAFSHSEPKWSMANGWMVPRDGDPRRTPARLILWGCMAALTELDDDGMYSCLHAVGLDAPVVGVDPWQP